MMIAAVNCLPYLRSWSWIVSQPLRHHSRWSQRNSRR